MLLISKLNRAKKKNSYFNQTIHTKRAGIQGRPFLSSTKTIYNLQANDESYEIRSTYLSVGNQVVA